MGQVDLLDVPMEHARCRRSLLIGTELADRRAEALRRTQLHRQTPRPALPAYPAPPAPNILCTTSSLARSISSIFSASLPPASAKSGRPPPPPPTIGAISFTIAPAFTRPVRSGVTATTI